MKFYIYILAMTIVSSGPAVNTYNQDSMPRSGGNLHDSSTICYVAMFLVFSCSRLSRILILGSGVLRIWESDVNAAPTTVCLRSSIGR